MVNNIKNNTVSEISAEKGLNTLNEIKNTEIVKYNRSNFNWQNIRIRKSRKQKWKGKLKLKWQKWKSK